MTGLTSALILQDLSFNEFVLLCTRAMGVCITMKDRPFTDPIPEKFIPDSHYKEALEKAEVVLEVFTKFREGDFAEAYARQDILESIKCLEKENSSDKNLKVLQKYNSIIQQAKDWIPPSQDHQGLKTFMISQLEESKKFDCIFSQNSSYLEEIDRLKSLDLMDHYRFLRKEAEYNVEYNRRHWQEEVQRVNERNEWMMSLVKSLL